MSPVEGATPFRGEVWWVSFDPLIGEEIQKTRPVIVISNDAANRVLNRIQVVPLTSNVRRLYPAEAYISIGSKRHKAMTDQLTTVSNKRPLDRMGRLTPKDMDGVERALKTQLGLA
jgi:mRNA interferase MazF